MVLPGVSRGQQTELESGGKLPPEYWKQIVAYSESVKEDDPVLGEYATLQRMNLIHLQNELASIKADLSQFQTTTETQMLQLRTTMHDYGAIPQNSPLQPRLTNLKAKAIRDFEYMNQLTILPDMARLDSRIFLHVAFPELANRLSEPFNTTYRTLNRKIALNGDVVREILRRYLTRRLSWSPSERKANKVGYHKGERPKTYSPFLDALARFIIAVGGGLSLIVPMLVMSFDASRTKSLVTVSVAVVLFALLLSLGFDTDNKDTLMATATYAAVLVVFVGTSSTGP